MAPHSGWRRGAAAALLGLGLLAGPGRPHARAPSAPVRLDAGAGPRSATELAKAIQNPIGDLYSFPFQNNVNLRVGPNRGTQDILNIQPVIPIHLHADWNVITRTILPLVWNPSLQPSDTVPFGTGPTTFSAFLSPARPRDGWLWGAGPVLQLPTASDPSLGSNVWGMGVTGVLVSMHGPWVAGALVNNIWSLGGRTGRGATRYSTALIQPFVNYNFDEGWYVGTSPVITANWRETGNNAWTLPIGGNVGRVVKIGGRLPVNFLLGAYHNMLRPEFGPTWQIRTQVTFIF